MHFRRKLYTETNFINRRNATKSNLYTPSWKRCVVYLACHVPHTAKDEKIKHQKIIHLHDQLIYMSTVETESKEPHFKY